MGSHSIRSRFATWLLTDIETKSDSISNLVSPDAWLTELLSGIPVESGVSVNPTTAMRCTTVFRAVNLIATSVGTMPAKLYKRLEQGGKEADTEHPAYKIAHDDATDWQSASQFREQLTTDALLHGAGYALVIRDAANQPVELLRIDPTVVTVKPNALGEPVYLIGSEQRRYSYRDILHLSAPTGIAPITACREAIGLAITLEKHAARLFGNGARPSGVVSIKSAETGGNVPPVALANIKAAWNATHGSGKSGGTAFLPGDATYQQLTLNSVDAQFAEMRAFQVVEIARAFGVPPVLLEDYSRATWSNSEQMGRQFLQFSLLPWLQAWQSAYRRALLTPEERATHVFEFVTDDLLRGDFASRVEGYAKLIAARVLNPNEVRALENRAPYVGGDEYANPNTTPGTLTPAPADDKEAEHV